MKPLTFSLLRLLADGEFHSGETMARTLAVSRASVWNALHALDEVGIEVFKVRGRGYRLAQALTLLERAQVQENLGERARDFSVEILDATESTNTLLLQQAAAGASSGRVIAAEWQTQGRGRRGRVWYAAPAGALTFSVLWRFQQGAGFLAGLSLAAGVAVARALAALGVGGVGLKWPNDVCWHGGKLAGILIEMQGDMLGPSAVVIGIGLNCRMSNDLRDRIERPVTDLESACGAIPDRNRLLALLLTNLACVLEAFARDGFAPFRDEWQRHHVFQSRMVRLELPDGDNFTGTVQGVADDGALLLATATGTRRFYGGDVSLRPG